MLWQLLWPLKTKMMSLWCCADDAEPKKSIIVLTRGFSGSSMTSKLESLSESSWEMWWPKSVSSLSAMLNEVKYSFTYFSSRNSLGLYKSMLFRLPLTQNYVMFLLSIFFSSMLYNSTFPSKFYSNFLEVKLSEFFSEVCLNWASWPMFYWVSWGQPIYPAG